MILATAGGYSLYYVFFTTKTGASSATSKTLETNQLIAPLAYEHWASIGEKNLSGIMSQYSSGYEALWWFVNYTGIGPANGRYDCNIPRGPNNCSYFPESAWRSFFNDTPSLTNYFVCNFSLTDELDGRIVVMAVIWYQLANRNDTLVVPFEIDFQDYNNTWAVWRDWFGLEQNQAQLRQGLVTPNCPAGNSTVP